MFSFLKTGDINNTIRTLTGFSGLSRSDSDAIKYSLLNHATAMRANVIKGLPIFTNIRQQEAELETRDINSITSGRLPSVAASIAASSSSSSPAFTPADLHRDNAALALIMAKELAFLNRTIQMISLIASRYQQEQEDAEYGKKGYGYDDDYCGSYGASADIETGDAGDAGDCGSMSDDDGDHDDYDDEPMTPRCGLRRSGSHESQNDTHTSGKNQLVNTFLVGSGRLQQKFINLCQLSGTNIVMVNAMTTMDRPHSAANYEKQHHAERLILSDIYLEFDKYDADHRDPVVDKYDADHRDPVVWAFLELRDISVAAWRMMSMLAFCNLIRLTQGSDFTINNPEDAIFSQERDYLAETSAKTAAAETAVEFNDDTTSSICGW